MTDPIPTDQPGPSDAELAALERLFDQDDAADTPHYRDWFESTAPLSLSDWLAVLPDDDLGRESA